MGVRVYFSRGSRDGALGHFLSAPLSEFRAWYIQQYTEEEGGLIDADPRFFPLLDAIIEHGATALQPQTMEQAKMIDDLVENFYSWCNLEREEILGEQIASPIKTYHYQDVAPQIRERFGEETARIWKYIRTGRAIGRPDSPFKYTGEVGYATSFWTSEEVAYLYARLLPFKDTFDVRHDDALICAFTAVETANKEGIGVIIECTM